MTPSVWFIICWLLIIASVVLFFVVPQKEVSIYCLALSFVISKVPKS